MYHHDVCPYCHGQNFILACQQPDGTLKYQEIVTLEKGKLYHIVCLACGTVVRTFMADPSQLLTTDALEVQHTVHEIEQDGADGV